MSEAPSPLPTPWILKSSADGSRTFYFNPSTKQRLSLIEPATPLSHCWGWLFKDRAKVYVNMESGEEARAWPPASSAAAAPSHKRRLEAEGSSSSSSASAASGSGEAASAAEGGTAASASASASASSAAPSASMKRARLGPVVPSVLPPGDLRIIAMSNRGQLAMLRNMLRSAAAVGMDLGLFDVYLTPEDSRTPSEAAAFGSQPFASVTALKLALIAREAAAHAAVLWVDNDIVFFSNPLDDLLARPHVPFLMQNDQWSPCTGFWLLRGGSQPAQREVLARSLEVMGRSGSKDAENDQSAFARACQECRVRPALLEDALYPNGRVYFERRQQERALMVHCNYLSTTAEKEKRLAEHGLWDPVEDILGRVHVVQLQHGDIEVPSV